MLPSATINNYKLISEIINNTFSNFYRGQRIHLSNHRVTIKSLHQLHMTSQKEEPNFFHESSLTEESKQPHTFSNLSPQTPEPSYTHPLPLLSNKFSMKNFLFALGYALIIVILQLLNHAMGILFLMLARQVDANISLTLLFIMIILSGLISSLKIINAGKFLGPKNGLISFLLASILAPIAIAIARDGLTNPNLLSNIFSYTLFTYPSYWSSIAQGIVPQLITISLIGFFYVNQPKKHHMLLTSFLGSIFIAIFQIVPTLWQASSTQMSANQITLAILVAIVPTFLCAILVEAVVISIVKKRCKS